jgi:hypothetical protein
MSAAQYIARFKPQEPHVDGDQEISDAESRVGNTSMENSVMGWTTKLHIMVPKADVFFHDMLTRTWLSKKRGKRERKKERKRKEMLKHKCS